MHSVLGIRLKPKVLPFSNIPAYLPPFRLSPQLAMRVAYLSSGPILGECSCSCFCYCLILLARTAAHTYTPNHLPIAFERDASCKDHDSTIVGDMNPEKLSTGLGMCCQVLRGNIEGTGGKGLVDGNINTADPSSVHPGVSNQVPSFIDHGYVPRLTNFLCLFLGVR